MKRIVLILITVSNLTLTQPPTGFRANYRFLTSGNRVADKNFYLLTLIDQSPDIKALLRQNALLRQIGTQRVALVRSHVGDTCTAAATLLTDFRLSLTDSARVAGVLRASCGRYIPATARRLTGSLTNTCDRQAITSGLPG